MAVSKSLLLQPIVKLRFPIAVSFPFIPESSMEDKKPLKILMADDDKDDQFFFKKALLDTNIYSDLTTVVNGTELMNILKDRAKLKPDIIFLDINMPLKDGKECLKEIKKDEELKDIPCVMISTSKNEKDIEETYNAGASLYVAKPDHFRSLVKILTKVLSLNWKEYRTPPLRKNFFISEKPFANFRED